jgi:serine/threonine protein phosphatase PrpC
MLRRRTQSSFEDEGAVRGGHNFSGGSFGSTDDDFNDISVHSTKSLHSDLSAHGISLALQGEPGTSSEKPSRTRKLRMYHHNAQRMQVGIAQAPAKKDQDRFAVDLTDDPLVPHYFGVFDGHGTSALAADLCTENLLQEILHADGIFSPPGVRWDDSRSRESSKESKSEPESVNSDDTYESSRQNSGGGKRGPHVPSDEAIKAGFYAIEQQVFRHVKEHPRSGTCAAVMFMGIDGAIDDDLAFDAAEAVVKVAWVGDCRIVMVDDETGEVTSLTRDHRVDDNENELDRVLNSTSEPRDGLLESQQWAVEVANANHQGVRPRATSFVAKRRIDGAAAGPKCIFAHSGGVSLQISRSIGDCYGPRSVISEPEIITLRAPSSQRARFIIASDGVFDVMSSEDAAKCVESYGDPVKAAAKLCTVSKSRRLYGGKSADDITAVVIDINRQRQSGSRGSLSRAVSKRLRNGRGSASSSTSSKCSIM